MGDSCCGKCIYWEREYLDVGWCKEAINIRQPFWVTDANMHRTNETSGDVCPAYVPYILIKPAEEE